MCVSDLGFIHFDLGSHYTVHINALSIELKCTSKGATCKLNFVRLHKISSLLTLETLKSELLQLICLRNWIIANRDKHFGTRHFGTYSIRFIVTSGHVISRRL